MNQKIRVVHYLNQFFAQVGGEDKGDVGPAVKTSIIGAGRALQQALGEDAEVVATIYCGDNFFAEQQEQAIAELLRHVAEYQADLLIAGPAFESGRYGVACGAICQAVQQKLGITAVAGMDEDNVGAGLFRKNIYIVNSGATIVRMVPTLQRMAALGLKLTRRETIGKPADEGYLSRGVKRNEFATKPPAERAVDMLLAKIAGKEFHSEIATPKFSSGKPAAPLVNLKSALIALVTDGGLVVEGNPDKIEPGRPTRFTTISIKGVDSLGADKYDAVHSGYDTASANLDPNRLVPLDTMRELAREGVIGAVHEFIHSTGGAHAAVENAVQIGRQIADQLKAAGVTGVILTST
ncbi:MAG: glycine/betaine/sarcosine/D-proline family reductase selenoprotein B [Deltaproteobacteria bacterium]|nr:glycine/betaine/sarcosine/D-proline family reductase selenoprotein B [Deltaproteobacteria bacterium]